MSNVRPPHGPARSTIARFVTLKHARMKVPVALALALCLVACGKPVPPEKASYVGLWRAPQMTLLITQDGSVKYERIEGGVTKSVSGPLKGFNGNNFDVGLGPFSTTFVVASPPHQDGEVTKMTVDGVELTKVAEQAASTSVRLVPPAGLTLPSNGQSQAGFAHL
jgi:hypothetical protein